MKRATSILLLFIYLFSLPGFKEVAKLPILMQHLLEHKKQDPSTTLFSFIEMHYAHGIVIDDDYNEDMKLPFKMLDFGSTSQFTFITYPIQAIISQINPTIETTILPIRYDFSLIQNFLNSIWQPPKL